MSNVSVLNRAGALMLDLDVVMCSQSNFKLRIAAVELELFGKIYPAHFSRQRVFRTRF